MLKLKKQKDIVIAGIVILFIYGCVSIHQSYFVEFPKRTAHHFQYGVIDALDYAQINSEKYSHVFISNKNALFQSYMFYLYSNKIDPGNYQKGGGTISGGFNESHNIGKFYFGDIAKYDQIGLYIVNPGELEGKRIKTVYYPDGREAMWIIEKL